MKPSGPAYGPCRSFAQPVSVPPLNHSSRLSATPSPSVSVSFQMLGGAETYSEPSKNSAPSGNIMWSAKTVRLSNLPSPSVSSRRTMRCGFSSSCSFTAALEPEDSATYNRPSSSNEATIGRSINGGAAASSIEKPGGTFGIGGADGALAAASIGSDCELIDAIHTMSKKGNRRDILLTPLTSAMISGVYLDE